MSLSPAAIVLAAGKGTRMKSDLPKVLHQAAGEPMVRHVVEALREIGATPIVLVVGHGADLVRQAFSRPEDSDRGRFRAIVEHSDADETERTIDEINPSVYAFKGATLASALPRVGRGNAKGEIYLTDVFSLLLADEAAQRLDSPAVEVVPAVPPEEVLSVNDPVQLAEVDRILRDRTASEGGRS
jgi:bifunctional N-acetylglucosamine-1-phosphate-uridyltransferase/glucosamine-1-phosphate-acetyltransferase GlmU-like protein